MKRVFYVLGALLTALGTLNTHASAGPPAGVPCPVFPADSFWHADVSRLPVHPRSAAWMANMGGAERRLHPDFGPSGESQPYGIPYVVVPGSRAKVSVDFEYADESDPGPYPFGADTPIEGGSDRHALMVDRDACVLYELFAAEWNGGSPTAGSGAVFDLRSNALRPSTWTSADAAGLAIFPGLLRLDEVRSGHIDHPIRMTAQRTDRNFVWPARHQAGAADDPSLPPMGAWFRMKSSFDVSRFRPETQVILRAFKTHGMILADNGSNWYFTGAADEGWDTDVLDELKSIPAGVFEAVDASSLMVHPDSGQVRGAASSPSPSPAGAPRPTPTTSGPRASAPIDDTAPPNGPPASTSTPTTPASTTITTATDAGPSNASDGGAAPESAQEQVKTTREVVELRPVANLYVAIGFLLVALAVAACVLALLRRGRRSLTGSAAEPPGE